MPASVVDHIVPHRGDMALFWDRSNWQAMSKLCHDRKTARENGGFGNLPATRPTDARRSK
jgi:5-methylcytosine-specific restriction protein A